MNPATITALLQAATQLALVIEEIKQGLLTQQQAWEQQQAALAPAIEAWTKATGGAGSTGQ